MLASEARIKANQKNAATSTDPKTDDGKERSRDNAPKHGMTGAGIALPTGDLAEIKHRSDAFAREIGAASEIGMTLARIMALNTVRVERSADQQALALAEHLRRVDSEFVAPEGVDQAEDDRPRREADRRAIFDTSKEADLDREHQAAERGFSRALKELRAMQRSARAEFAAAA